jgi:hypothetical protein
MSSSPIRATPSRWQPLNGRHRARPRCSSCFMRRALPRILAITVISVVLIVVLVGSATASDVHALHSEPVRATTVIPDPPAVNDLPTVIRNARNWFIGILSAVMLFFFTLGAARYIAAGSDPSETERAKGLMKGSVLGYALGMMASVVLAIVQQIIGVK